MAGYLTEALAEARSRVSVKAAPALSKGAAQAFANVTFGGNPFASESRGYSRIASAEEQALHYRGRVYSAIAVTVSRISRQPILAARQLTPGSKRKAYAQQNKLTLKHALDRGDVEWDQIPRWVCKSASRAEDLEILENHPVLDVFHDPNPIMVRSNLWQSTIPSLDVTGVAYWVMDRDPDMIIPVPATWMIGVMRPDGLDFSHFLMKPPRHPGEPLRIPAENVARFFNADPFDLFGIFSPLQAVARTVLADEAIESAKEANFRNAMRPAMAVMTGDETGKAVRLQPEQRGQIVSWIRREMAGAEKNGSPVVCDSFIRDVKPIFDSPAEMDYMQSGKSTKADLYENWATSPIIAGMVEGANRAGSAVAEFNYAANRANPMASLISEVMTEKVAPFFNDGTGKLFLWIEEIKPHDPDHQRNLLRDIRDGGGMMVDEHRKYVGLPPLPNDMGQVIIRKVNMVAVPVDGSEPTVYAPPAPEPTEEPEGSEPETSTESADDSTEST